VLAGAVASVDQRDVDELAGHLRGAFAGVAQDERVGVALDDADGVGEALAFRDA
jgi:hypothetical protein